MSEEVWLCVEKGNLLRPTSYISWAMGVVEEHCWFLGAGGHYPECGLYQLARVSAVTENTQQ